MIKDLHLNVKDYLYRTYDDGTNIYDLHRVIKDTPFTEVLNQMRAPLLNRAQARDVYNRVYDLHNKDYVKVGSPLLQQKFNSVDFADYFYSEPVKPNLVSFSAIAKFADDVVEYFNRYFNKYFNKSINNMNLVSTLHLARVGINNVNNMVIHNYVLGNGLNKSDDVNPFDSYNFSVVSMNVYNNSAPVQTKRFVIYDFYKLQKIMSFPLKLSNLLCK